MKDQLTPALLAPNYGSYCYSEATLEIPAQTAMQQLTHNRFVVRRQSRRASLAGYIYRQARHLIFGLIPLRCWLCVLRCYASACSSRLTDRAGKDQVLQDPILWANRCINKPVLIPGRNNKNHRAMSSAHFSECIANQRRETGAREVAKI